MGREHTVDPSSAPLGWALPGSPAWEVRRAMGPRTPSWTSNSHLLLTELGGTCLPDICGQRAFLKGKEGRSTQYAASGCKKLPPQKSRQRCGSRVTRGCVVCVSRRGGNGGKFWFRREITLVLERKIMEIYKFHFQSSIWLYGKENSVTTFR